MARSRSSLVRILSRLASSIEPSSATTLSVPSTRRASTLAWMAPTRSSIGLRRAISSSGVRIAFAIGYPPYRYLALRRRSSSWFVSLVLTMPERLPLDMTPMRLVMPRISGISEETTMMVLPSFAILMMSS